MWSSLEAFSRLTPSQRRAHLCCLALLGYYQIALKWVSFRRLSAALSHHRGPQCVPSLQEQQKGRSRDMGEIVARVARHTPWQSTCLAQVLVLQRLLSKSGIPGQFFLGVCMHSDPEANLQELAAHAWLQCGEEIINGEDGHTRFTIVSSYSWRGENA